MEPDTICVIWLLHEATPSMSEHSKSARNGKKVISWAIFEKRQQFLSSLCKLCSTMVTAQAMLLTVVLWFWWL